MRDRLIELIRGAKKNMKGANSDLHREYIFADYLLNNGVIVPPCKVGDTIYQLCKGYKSYILEYEVIEISILEDFTDIIATSKKCPFAYPDRFSLEQFGKTIFLTKEEAEKHLGGVQE